MSAIQELNDDKINHIREKEYPNLSNHVYLDHAGMTLYSRCLIENASKALVSNLMANPHSLSTLSKNTERLVHNTRSEVLKLFKADPAIYDIAFTANATGAIKILAESIKDTTNGRFKYYYNVNSHTSVLGVRSLCDNYFDFKMFSDMDEMTGFLKTDSEHTSDSKLTLIAWPGQSNFNGERLPMNSWNTAFKAYATEKKDVFTLFDASSLCTTSPPDLSDSATSPDFICCSFYKMFGYPDLGGLIFKKSEGAKIFPNRKYFGGGTIDSLSPDDSFVARRSQLFETIEDGTLPIHSIVQLSEAIKAHDKLYGNYKNISLYTKKITIECYNKLLNLRYPNNQRMIEIYSPVIDELENGVIKELTMNNFNHGPIIAFSLLDENARYLGYFNFEKFASARDVSLRTGGVCNVGGVCKWLNTNAKELENAYNSGHTCGDEMDIINERPSGIVRVSFGAMTNSQDIDTLIKCIKEFTSSPDRLSSEPQGVSLVGSYTNVVKTHA
ncbi:catalytic activity protein [[Candida] boidinii]|nr:catalytic activity protein [[Candida] boidinii]